MTTYGKRFNDAVAAELRAERGRKKTTIMGLVQLTGLSKSAILNYLNGNRDIPTPALMELCNALGIDPRVIFDRAYQTVQDDSGMQI